MANISKQQLIDLLTRCRNAMQYANSILDVKTNPTPYDDGQGPGQSWNCDYYGSKKNFIEEKKRRYKWYDTGNSNFKAGNQLSAISDYNNFRATIKAIHTQMKNALTKAGVSYPQSVEVSQFSDASVFNPYTLAMYNSLFNSIVSIENALKQCNSYYNSNNYCILTCQVNCQTSCQTSCQWVHHCHDQKCGAH